MVVVAVAMHSTKASRADLNWGRKPTTETNGANVTQLCKSMSTVFLEPLFMFKTNAHYYYYEQLEEN